MRSLIASFAVLPRSSAEGSRQRTPCMPPAATPRELSYGRCTVTASATRERSGRPKAVQQPHGSEHPPRRRLLHDRDGGARPPVENQLARWYATYDAAERRRVRPGTRRHQPFRHPVAVASNAEPVPADHPDAAGRHRLLLGHRGLTHSAAAHLVGCVPVRSARWPPRRAGAVSPGCRRGYGPGIRPAEAGPGSTHGRASHCSVTFVPPSTGSNR